MSEVGGASECSWWLVGVMIGVMDYPAGEADGDDEVEDPGDAMEKGCWVRFLPGTVFLEMKPRGSCTAQVFLMLWERICSLPNCIILNVWLLLGMYTSVRTTTVLKTYQHRTPKSSIGGDDVETATMNARMKEACINYRQKET